MTHRFIHLIFSLAGLFLLLSCHQKDPDPQPQKLDLSCVKLTNENGESLGLYGGCTTSPDWGQIALSSEESALVGFSDTVSIAGTVAATITEVLVFPNPAIHDGSIALSLRSAVPDQLVKLKMIIVNEDKTVLGRYSLRARTNQTFALQLPATVYPPGKPYRLYYRVGAQANANLFEGYGNILICKQQVINGNIDGDCF